MKKPSFAEFHESAEAFHPCFTQQSPQNPNWRTHKQENIRKLSIKRGKNPLDRYSNPTKCAICHSINLWAQNCPDRESKNTYVVNEVVLHQSDYNNPTELKHLTSETWSSALLDCGASKTVCGKEWLTQYINNLSDTDHSKVLFGESNHIHRFGNGRKVNALHSVKIPATIGSQNLEIKTDVVDNDIPVLFSKSSMKQLINNLNRESDMSITLTMTNDKDNHHIALKLHRKFAHPSQEKLLLLIKNAGEPWHGNQNLGEEMKNISNNCPTCKKYKKVPPSPVVGLPMATEFQETVAMDLKFYDSKIILHLVDHCTQLSASSFIPNKNPDTILTFIFKIWVSVYGAPETFLTDNGGEFAKAKLIEMAESLGISCRGSMVQRTHRKT